VACDIYCVLINFLVENFQTGDLKILTRSTVSVIIRAVEQLIIITSAE